MTLQGLDGSLRLVNRLHRRGELPREVQPYADGNACNDEDRTRDDDQRKPESELGIEGDCRGGNHRPNRLSESGPSISAFLADDASMSAVVASSALWGTP